MEQSVNRVPPAETGRISIEEQVAVRNLALDVQEIAGIYKKERDAGRDGTDIPLMFISGDISQLKELGILDKYKGPLKKIGADPIIRFAILSQIDQSEKDLEGEEDKSAFLENIRMHLELGEALGLSETAGNPDFEDAAGLFKSYKDKYQTLEGPEEQPAPVIETPKKEPAPEEVSKLAARLREAMNPKEEDDYSERVRKRDMATELEKELGELLNLPPEASFEALEKSRRDLDDVSRYWSKMSILIEDLYKNPAQISTINRILSQISQDVMETYKRYPHSLYYKLLESAGEDKDNNLIDINDINGPLQEWTRVANMETPTPDELRLALLNKNQAFIADKERLTREFQKVIDILSSAAEKEGLKFQESEYGVLELIKSTKPAQAPKGPGFLRRLADAFRKGESGSDIQTKQIVKNLDEADGETIRHYYELIDGLDDDSVREIGKKGIELALLFEKGPSPANLGKLTEFSEMVAGKLEESGKLDPAEHPDNIKNLLPTLWNNIKVELQRSK